MIYITIKILFAFLKTWGNTWVDVLSDGQNPNDVENSWDNIRNYITGNDMEVCLTTNTLKIASMLVV